MKIWVHLYRLTPTVKSLKPRDGALLKVEWAVGQVGYSDLHPWPEFGEPSLEEQLQSLAYLKLTPLAEKSLEFNYQDREYRLLKRSAFLGLILPRSHRLILNLTSLDTLQLNEWQSAGYTHLKVKMGKDLKRETETLTQLALASPLQWRIDLNGRLETGRFLEWWKSLEPTVRARVDFIEDPVKNGETLPEAGPWATDWVSLKNAGIRVVKAARDNADQLMSYDRVIFTHGMDHPLGQACAAWAASKFYARYPKKTEICGLADPDVYEPNLFSEVWRCPGPRLKPTPGMGFGFDEQLEAVAWERIL
ncbi:MAG: hypothetical protein AB7G93_11095 [Bdellovibrionales bacterium]